MVLNSNKILIVSFHFPPTKRFGGAIRWKAFLEYLPQYGWDPLLIASLESKENISYSGVIKIKPWLSQVGRFHLDQWGWIPPLYIKLKKILKKNKVHSVVLSGPPMWYLGIIVPILKRQYPNTKIVVDFRDPWVLNRVRVNIKFPNNILQKFLAPKLEHSIFDNADSIIMATPGMQMDAITAYPFANEKIFMLSNGFKIPNIEIKYPDKGPFTVLYAGSFDANQNPACIFEGAKNLIGLDIRLLFIGPIKNKWKRIASEMGVDKIVSFLSKKSHETTLRYMNNSHAFLQLLPETDGYNYIVSGKTFEYIYFGRPIILISNSGDCSNLLKEYSGVFYHISDYSSIKISKALLNLYQRWKQKENYYYYNLNNFNYLYDRKQLTANLSKILIQK